MNSDAPKTAIVRARVDVRKIASIANFYTARGIFVGNKNQLINRIINDWYDSLVFAEEAQPVESTVTAVSILENIGLSKLAEQTRASRSFITQVGRESLEAEERSSTQNSIAARAIQNLQNNTTKE